MKGGQKPIHIQRWAPFDFVNDPVVKFALSERNYAALVLYILVLNHSFLEGGDLPANVPALAAVIGMPKKDVEKSLGFWLDPPLDKPKLFIEETCLFNGRVKREVSEELAFRSEQVERGRDGGRAAALKRALQRSLQPTLEPVAEKRCSPPSPAPTPAPSPHRHDQEPADVMALQRDIDGLIREIQGLTGDNYDEILLKGSSVNGNSGMASLWNCTSERYLRKTKSVLVGMNLKAKQRATTSGHPTETPEEAARRRLKATGTE